MGATLLNDPVLVRFRAALTETHGDRLERAVLFGSRARGDLRADSDYDTTVFIRDPDPWFDEAVRLANLGVDILMDTGAVISAKPFRAGAYGYSSSFMGAIRSEGREL